MTHNLFRPGDPCNQKKPKRSTVNPLICPVPTASLPPNPPLITVAQPPQKRTLGKTKRELTARARLILEEIVNGASEKEALKTAGYSDNRIACGRNSIVRNPMMQRTFAQFLDKAGITDNFLAVKARALLDAQQTHFFQLNGIVTDERTTPALETQRKTLELAAKLKGHLKEQSAGDINIGLMQMVVQAVRGSTDEDG